MELLENLRYRIGRTFLLRPSLLEYGCYRVVKRSSVIRVFYLSLIGWNLGLLLDRMRVTDCASRARFLGLVDAIKRALAVSGTVEAGSGMAGGPIARETREPSSTGDVGLAR